MFLYKLSNSGFWKELLVGTACISIIVSLNFDAIHSLLVYINDLCNVSKVLELILFADDTNIFYSHTDASYLMEVVNLELKKITCWFYTNKLSINVKKSNFIIFRPRQNRQTLDPAFNISSYSIDRVKEATFLGVILDEHLTWKSHIHNVARKVSKAIGIIYKSSFFLNNFLFTDALF